MLRDDPEFGEIDPLPPGIEGKVGPRRRKGDRRNVRLRPKRTSADIKRSRKCRDRAVRRDLGPDRARKRRVQDAQPGQNR